MSNFVSKTKKKLIRKKKLCRPTVPNFFGDVSGNKELFFTPYVAVLQWPIIYLTSKMIFNCPPIRCWKLYIVIL